jgi:twitching motility protein PilI
MARAAKLDLRVFQQELAARLASTSDAEVDSTRLGLVCGGGQWLTRLADAAEVVPVPPIVTVPLTQPWFAGIANIRGNLYSVVDLAAFLGRDKAEAPGGAAHGRLVLFGARAGDLRAGVLVQRVLGLRSVAEFTASPPPPAAPDWFVQRWVDADGGEWQEIDLARLARDPSFLQVGL